MKSKDFKSFFVSEYGMQILVIIIIQMIEPNNKELSKMLILSNKPDNTALLQTSKTVITQYWVATLNSLHKIPSISQQSITKLAYKSQPKTGLLYLKQTQIKIKLRSNLKKQTNKIF